MPWVNHSAPSFHFDGSPSGRILSGEIVTVYSNVACPQTREMWYALGGYPAASHSNWQKRNGHSSCRSSHVPFDGTLSSERVILVHVASSAVTGGGLNASCWAACQQWSI